MCFVFDYRVIPLCRDSDADYLSEEAYRAQRIRQLQFLHSPCMRHASIQTDSTPRVARTTAIPVTQTPVNNAEDGAGDSNCLLPQMAARRRTAECVKPLPTEQQASNPASSERSGRTVNERSTTRDVGTNPRRTLRERLIRNIERRVRLTLGRNFTQRD